MRYQGIYQYILTIALYITMAYHYNIIYAFVHKLTKPEKMFFSTKLVIQRIAGFILMGKTSSIGRLYY